MMHVMMITTKEYLGKTSISAKLELFIYAFNMSNNAINQTLRLSLFECHMD